MNKDVFFLKKLHQLMVRLDNERTDSVVDEIKALVLSHAEILTDDEATNDFIGKLIFYTEKNIADSDVTDFLACLHDFYVHFLYAKPCDIYYVGLKENEHKITHIIPKSKINSVQSIYLENTRSIPNDKLSVDAGFCRPVIISDHIGAFYLRQQAVAADCLSVFYLSKDMNHLHINDIDMGFIPILNQRYEKLVGNREINTTIIGSSYTYQAFPERELYQAQNLSIYGGDLTLSYSLMKHLLEKTQVKNFIISLGYQDMFYELSLAKNSTSILTLLRYFCQEHNIEYLFSKTEEVPRVYGRAPVGGILDEYLYDIFNKQAQSEEDKLSEDGQIRHYVQSKMHSVQNSIEFIENRSYCTDFSYSSKEIENRTQDLSRNYRYKQSFANNKTVVENILSLVQQHNAKVYFFIPPFTKYFNQLYHQELKQETVAYINSIANENVKIMNLSEDIRFTPEDFYDADHLNYQGGQKVCDIFKHEGLAL